MAPCWPAHEPSAAFVSSVSPLYANAIMPVLILTDPGPSRRERKGPFGGVWRPCGGPIRTLGRYGLGGWALPKRVGRFEWIGVAVLRRPPPPPRAHPPPRPYAPEPLGWHLGATPGHHRIWGRCGATFGRRGRAGRRRGATDPVWSGKPPRVPQIPRRCLLPAEPTPLEQPTTSPTSLACSQSAPQRSWYDLLPGGFPGGLRGVALPPGRGMGLLC